MSNYHYDYPLSGIEDNPHFERINALLVWPDENGRWGNCKSNYGILARPVNEEVTRWDDVPADCVAFRCDNASWESEYYAYVQIKVTGRIDRRIPGSDGLYGRKVKVTFQSDGEIRDGFVVNYVQEEN